MSDVVIRVSNVKKTYRRYKKNFQKIQNLLLLQDAGEKISVLRDVSFEIRRGEKVGLIATPQSGKTTLMRVLAGIITPDKGEVEVNGKVTTVFDHKLGFQSALTGRDNYEIRCTLMGWTKEEMQERAASIFRYSGVTDDIVDEPISTYKKTKPNLLGYTIATVERPEIMLYDEKFNLGTKKAVRNTVERLRKLIDSPDITFLMSVSNVEIGRKLCRRGIVLHHGKVVFDGDFDEAIEYYKSNCRKKKVSSDLRDEEDSGEKTYNGDQDLEGRNSDREEPEEPDVNEDSDGMGI